MKSKNIILITLLLCILLTGAVSATDTSKVAVDDDVTEKISNTNSQTDIGTSNTENVQSTNNDNSKLNENNNRDIISQANDVEKKGDAENSETVTNYASLVSAVGRAKTSSGNNYTINLAEGTYDYTSTISWNTAAKTLIINGNNQTINGKQKGPFIKIMSGAILILNNITISNFKTTSNGGAIALQISGDLNTNNVVFKDNSARVGGAIWIQRTNTNIAITISNTTFINNTATASGGAIWNGQTPLEIDECNFINNSVTGYGAGGGAISTQSNPNTPTIIKNSNFTDNKNIDKDGDAGAIYAMNSLSIETSTFVNNSAKRNGGAICADNSGTLNVTNSEFTENKANKIGGAIYATGNTNIAENTFMNDEAPTGAEISANNGLMENNIIININSEEPVNGKITQKNDDYSKIINYLMDLIKEQKDLIDELTTNATTLNQTVQQQKDLIDELTTNATTLNNTLNTTQEALQNATEKIDELNNTLNTTQEALQDSQDQIKELKTQNKNLENSITKINKNINNIKKAIRKPKITLSLKTITTVRKKAKKLVLQSKLKIDGKSVKGKTVTFVFKNKKFKSKTNTKGVAKFTIKKSVLKKLLKKVKVGKKIKYQAKYSAKKVTKSVKVKK